MAETGVAAPLDRLNLQIRVCRRCPLCESRTVAVPGEGPVPARLMLVGEAPGEKEDKAGRPFVGNAGRMLDRLLADAGLRREDCFITGAVKCHPPKNRDPRAGEIDACRVYLEEQLAAVRPEVVLAMGRAAMRAVLGHEPPPELTLGHSHGQPVRRDGYRLFPTYHPAAAFYREELRETIQGDLRRLGELLRAPAAHDSTNAERRSP